MALDNGVCTSCSSLFNGCGNCNSEECKSCSEEGYILTPNGCYYHEVPLPSSSSPSTSEKPKPPASSSGSKPLPPPKSSSEGGSNAGMIAGIVVGVIVVVAIVAVAIYCVATAGSKHGKVDPSIYEEGTEFETMSIL